MLVSMYADSQRYWRRVQYGPDKSDRIARPVSIMRLATMALAALLQAEPIACFLLHDARVPASLFPILSGERSAEHESFDVFRR
jgi:hypothetical protein